MPTQTTLTFTKVQSPLDTAREEIIRRNTTISTGYKINKSAEEKPPRPPLPIREAQIPLLLAFELSRNAQQNQNTVSAESKPGGFTLVEQSISTDNSPIKTQNCTPKS